MSIESAIFAGFKAAYIADTGSTGLNNAVSPAFIRATSGPGDAGAARRRDPNLEEARSPNRPYVLLESDETCIDSSGKQNFRSRVRFHIHSKREEGFSAPDAISDRIEALMRATALTDPAGVWAFSKAGRFIDSPGPTGIGDIDLHQILECTILASTGGALSSGVESSFTWAASGGITLTATMQGAWSLRESRTTRTVTPWSWKGEKRTSRLRDADGSVSYLASASDATSPPPDGAVGTLVLKETPARSHTFTALMHTMSRDANVPEAAEQVITYRFEMSAQTNALPITVA